MKHKKLLSIFMAVSILVVNYSAMSVSADETTTVQTTTSDNVESEGLILSASLSITAATKIVRINAKTFGTDTMAKIGFKNIEIQRSSNGSSGWTKELDLNDDIATNTDAHYKDYEQHSVVGGYYYRVKLDHYAKETGWWFPSSLSVTNYSNVVWVPAS